MMRIQLCVLLGLLFNVGALMGEVPPEDALLLSLRAYVGAEHLFVRQMTNRADVVAEIGSGFLSDANTLAYGRLDTPMRTDGPLGVNVNYVDPPPPMTLAPGHSERASVSRAAVFGSQGTHPDIGCYLAVRWEVERWASPTIHVAVEDALGVVRPAVVDPEDTSVVPILACVFRRNAPQDIAFLLLNGTNADVPLPPPLVNESRLVVTASSINYSNEVFSVESAPELVQVEPGKTHVWRIPWTTVFARLPEADRAQLHAAKDIDLIWKAGAFVSDPLPLTLPDPE